MDTNLPTNTMTPIPTTPQTSSLKEFIKTNKQTLILAGVLIGAILITGASFYFGYQQQMYRVEPAPTPTPTPVETTIEPSPIENLTPTVTDKPSPTPKPTPKPTATNTPTPTAIPFTISAVSTSVDAIPGDNTCPYDVKFRGKITANGPGSVTYRWDRSNGTYSDTHTLVFTLPGQLDAEDITWKQEASGSGNMKLHTLTPSEIISSAASFDITCH